MQSETTLVLETVQKIERIKKTADAQVAEEYRTLVNTFQDLYGVDAKEARYLIFQAELKLGEADSF